MEEVSVLLLAEPVRLNSDRLDELHRQLGPGDAEEVVCRAMEELAVRLTHMEQMHRNDEQEALRKSARSLSKIADQIGMCGLARVAGDVINCIDAVDRVSLAATLARLMRVGERSLTAIWDLQDMTV